MKDSSFTYDFISETKNIRFSIVQKERMPPDELSCIIEQFEAMWNGWA
jgi:hypothetical protein